MKDFKQRRGDLEMHISQALAGAGDERGRLAGEYSGRSVRAAAWLRLPDEPR